MTDVLLVAASQPQLGVLAGAVQKFRALGASVYLACAFDAKGCQEELDRLELDGYHQLPYGIGHLSTSTRRKLKKVPHSRRLWIQSRRNVWLRRHGLGAQQLVALDANAVYTVWRLAQYNTGAGASFGIAPALRALENPRVPGRPSAVATRRKALVPPPALLASDVRRQAKALPQTMLRTATARPVMRSSVGARLWRTALGAPGVPAKVRAALSRQVAEGMRWAGRPGGATLALTTAAGRISDRKIRTGLLDEAVKTELNKGIAPRALDRTVNELLASADEYYKAGDPAAAASTLDRALVLGFHRVVHIDQLSSPLAADPEAFSAPVHRSAVMKKIVEPRGRKTPAATPPADRPLRLLVTTSANDNFLKLILSHYEAHQGVEVRYLDLAASPAMKRLSWAGRRMIENRLGGDALYAEQVETLMRPHLDWADTVFLDWCVAPAVMLTTIDPGDTRIVVRLHSYEAFTRWPHLVDFSRVDDLVYVADHVQDLTTSLVPQLRGPQAPRTHMLDNAMDLSAFNRAKPADARFNLGLIGISQVAKDPLWAIDVLQRVRKADERYRLLLVGSDMDRKTSRATKDYLAEFEKQLAPLEESGAVVRLGPTDDVPSALTEIGTILSSSVREGCHVGLMEGAASAAVPVVRDWPFYAGREHSARTLYPEGWVVGSPEEAAKRILETTATEENWRNAGKLASEHALSAWDWPVVSRRFDKLLLGE
ncbi:glycosyltransferase family 1 protein [Streptomyces sp. NBC_01210]|uniref:glycosyltransferase family 1 protein n=1 Tax=Streptomyces sp. NBC_01210 TaxID=2903774 RepID=UPI002E0F6792|nr:glycosyltransferase family 1 protein [Streptomyces sp. NBC_01210]